MVASAHIEITSGAAEAGGSEKVVFGVGHGCAGADTYSVKIDIPAGVTSVRAMPDSFGKVTVQKDSALNVTSVTWQRADGDVLPSDDDYYELTIKMKLPNAPFTTVYFPTHQTCKSSTGELTVVDWLSMVESEDPNAPEPAPALLLLPPHLPGWNKFTVPMAVADLSEPFADAQIVWKDSAAYSINPETVAQIAKTAGVSALSTLAAGDVVWVKY